MFRLTTCLGLTLIVMLGGCQTSGSLFGPLTGLSNSTPPQDYDHPGMLDPSQADEQAPDVYRVKVVTTKGDFVLECYREWSPNGADRFYNLCKIGYMKDIALFRAIENFMFQFGIHGDPAVNAAWSKATFPDDPVKEDVSNRPGTITFAKTPYPNSRSTQLFINFVDNSRLDADGFTPFGKIVEGMDVIKKINTEYGAEPGELQGEFKQKGNDFIRENFSRIDFIKSATIIDE